MAIGRQNEGSRTENVAALSGKLPEGIGVLAAYANRRSLGNPHAPRPPLPPVPSRRRGGVRRGGVGVQAEGELECAIERG